MNVDNLKLITPDFESSLVDVLFELDHVRRLKLGGSTHPMIFFQLKSIFHMLESVGSARIEGNRTTISEYVEKKIVDGENKTEQFSEIANVEKAMEFIESSIQQDAPLSHQFIRELHYLTVCDLDTEGDKTPGAYRTWSVDISQSPHSPPEHYLVQQYMENLLNFINEKSSNKHDLLKIAQAHHIFTWIHPFGNGNGRTVRLLTYALLIKYGFNVKDGGILNPSAVFFNDRNKYYEMLSVADKGTDENILEWTEYVLSGILEEIEKINKLTDYTFLSERILLPSILHSKERGLINDTEYKILTLGVSQQIIASKDISTLGIGLTARQTSSIITTLKNSKLIVPIEEGARKYYINFSNSYLLRSVIIMLEKENFIPELNK